MPAKEKNNKEEVAASAKKKRTEEVTAATNNKPEGKEVATPQKSSINLNKLLPIAITAVASLLAVIIPAFLTYRYQTSKLQTQINDLTNQITQRDAQINSLTNELNNMKQPLREILKRDGRADFEWQWAGENWYGRVNMEQQGNRDVITQAQVGLLEKKLSDESSMVGQVFNLVRDTSNINITDDGIVHLQFSAMKKDRRLGTTLTVIVTGDLQQKLCYAGKVNYKYVDTGNQYSGDMILVNYRTSLGEQIDNWFAPNTDQPWFDRYIVDR